MSEVWTDDLQEEQGLARIEFVHGPCHKYIHVPFDKDREIDYAEAVAFLDERIHQLFDWQAEVQVTLPNGETRTHEFPIIELLATVIRNIAVDRDL